MTCLSSFGPEVSFLFHFFTYFATNLIYQRDFICILPMPSPEMPRTGLKRRRFAKNVSSNFFQCIYAHTDMHIQATNIYLYDRLRVCLIPPPWHPPMTKQARDTSLGKERARRQEIESQTRLNLLVCLFLFFLLLN
jgi:hypothetical protein